MVKFETIRSVDVKLGGNNFLEVAHKKAITTEGENEFISLSRGFITMENEKRFKRSVAIPYDRDVVENVKKALESLLE